MKQKLSFGQTITVASMLFGMFFGAGNLIFPVHLGQLAGSNTWPAVIGFIITGVGLPLLGVAAFGVSRSSNLVEMSGKVGKVYSIVFTMLLYLTIGPFFAIPRCATVSFTVGIEPIVGESSAKLWLLAFSFIFFALVLFFSLRPSKIMDTIGKYLNPLFLLFLAILLVTALVNPLASASEIAPDSSYASGAFFHGFLEGYNTMDGLACLAFGIVIIDVIRSLSIDDPASLTGNTIRAGIFSCAAMAIIYIAITFVGTQSRGMFELSENGGIALYQIASHYLGVPGAAVLALTVTFACLKTSIALVTSCSHMFSKIMKKTSYKFWAIVISTFAFIVANIGLTAIITYAIPCLMFLYPLVITIILLSLFSNLFGGDRAVFLSVTICTLFESVFDFICALPASAFTAAVKTVAVKIFPFFSIGVGFICPAVIGLVIGLIIHFCRKPKAA